jgi:hypothetical protein
VHVLTLAEHIDEITRRLQAIPGVQHTLTASVGGPATLIGE